MLSENHNAREQSACPNGNVCFLKCSNRSFVLLLALTSHCPIFRFIATCNVDKVAISDVGCIILIRRILIPVFI